jgi:hypothetical protein
MNQNFVSSLCEFTSDFNPTGIKKGDLFIVMLYDEMFETVVIFLLKDKVSTVAHKTIFPPFREIAKGFK